MQHKETLCGDPLDLMNFNSHKMHKFNLNSEIQTLNLRIIRAADESMFEGRSSIAIWLKRNLF